MYRYYSSTLLLRSFARRKRQTETCTCPSLPGGGTDSPKRKDYSWPAGLRVGSQGTSCRRKQTGRDLVWQVLPVRAELSCWAQRTAHKLNKQQTWQTHARQNAKFCSDSDTASKSEAGNNDLRHTGLTSQGLVNRARL